LFSRFCFFFALVAVVLSLVAIEIFAWKYSEQFTRETEAWLNTIRETGYFQMYFEENKEK